ncbi:uncharacterized protein LOC106873295 [Octopus bimaculoides]|uniref:uncharacterized protein LOC106873295 n=1 Tax=Octopus bimaculoides TaxID=37653 RepID=UPI00071DC2E2|nr:uncharacterized protein LOC106873295 [Octopus bimaculoides]|eukprot:XP_014776090.1 PREDICTED: uncharacterized protein LOC106873295 [Octopus bimaculoides]
MDILLKPFPKYIKCYIRYDLHTLNHLPEKVKEETFMVTFDVINLYTNIPHNYGTEAIWSWLDKYPEEIPERINKDFIIQSLRFVLQNNQFMFDTTVYRQKSGIAMGTRAAPTIANLTMGYLEITIYQESFSKFGNPLSQYISENWKGFWDDCFIHWNDNIDKLLEFKTLLDSINTNIQFTMEHNQE